MSLTEKRCTACEGGVSPMDSNEARQYLAEVPGWTLTHDDTRIARRFKTQDFASALAFTQTIGALAEEEDHHPQITLGWGFVEVELYTHKIGGLHQNDFILAAKINQAWNAAGG
ncbi:4a-hydroxytetrahydrobiopterin dehydratase [Alkalispirillum mobile]|uniref:Putative pterin-4-alpha-carbinolamine dehydratase n=2 Tax=Alkalispirillum mobile TaxID=85925 RepID=A0A498C833_9GAMM|nr:4a-hydroxytetrahydrobiopterin dehydratase [Alkalispirillum mobile]